MGSLFGVPVGAVVVLAFSGALLLYLIVQGFSHLFPGAAKSADQFLEVLVEEDGQQWQHGPMGEQWEKENEYNFYYRNDDPLGFMEYDPNGFQERMDRGEFS
ncbi:hypothetical protein [Thioalkalivibrio sp. ALgr3]|uniref:hypothetical protein n=1 Tax=Thioalkalivibrio sp. ALgr3 TaxID=1239292 RepID=UPI00036C795D|nr:hypothetical protein [Thioalkalivibrio sp. ALgr3]